MNPPTGREPTTPRPNPRPAESESEAYTIQIFFDPRENVFCATFLEFPEIGVADPSREEVMFLAEERLHSHLAALRQAGKPVPEPFLGREYPSSIEIALSQTLSKKLENIRQQERVSLEQLVTEILTSAVERKAETRQPQGGGGKDRHSRGGGGGNRQQGGGRGGRRGSNYQQTMDSRENFMEYVRNLEKGGGPGYKKR